VSANCSLPPGLRPELTHHPHSGPGSGFEGACHPTVARLVGGFPGITGDVPDDLAVFHGDDELGYQSGVTGFGILHQDANLIPARLELGGNLSLPRLAPTVVRGFGDQAQVRVDGKPHRIVGGGAHLGPLHLHVLRQVERVVEKALTFRGLARRIRRVPNPFGRVERGLDEGLLVGLVVADPFGLPIAGLQQAIDQLAGLLQGDSRPSLSQTFTFQKQCLMRDERLALVGGTDGLIAGDLVYIPEIALVLEKKLLGAGHDYPPSRLPLAALSRFDNPAQARGALINPGGIDEVFTTQIRGREALAGVGFGVGEQQEQRMRPTDKPNTVERRREKSVDCLPYGGCS